MDSVAPALAALAGVALAPVSAVALAPVSAVALAPVSAVALARASAVAPAWASAAAGQAWGRIPADARQLIVVSSPTAAPSDYLASLRAYRRPAAGAAWRPVFPTWPAETGSGHLLPAAQRREGDHATPIGVFRFGMTLYGNEPNPGGLHYRYHQLACGDWWDEDPYSPQYNQFVHVPCGETPSFAAWSEALWTERVAYPYMAVIRFNMDPTVAGPHALGSGIFLHSWMDAPTEGCVALHTSELLTVLRWLRPSEHPVIEIRVTDTTSRAGYAG